MKLFFLASMLACLSCISPAYAATTAMTTSNIIIVNTAPTLTIAASSNSVDLGQSVTFTANVPSGGYGPFSVNFMYDGNVIGANTIDSPGGNASLTFTPTDIGALSFNAVAVDTGTTNAGTFIFNSTSYNVTVNATLSTTANGTVDTVVDLPAGNTVALNYTPAEATLDIYSSNSIAANVLILDRSSNFTGAPEPTAPNYASKFSTLSILNLSLTNASGVSYGMTVYVPCGSNSTPYEYNATTGAWEEIPILASGSSGSLCTISFDIPSDPVIGVFELNGVGVLGSGGTGASGSSSGSPAAAPPTTAATTTPAATTTIPPATTSIAAASTTAPPPQHAPSPATAAPPPPASSSNAIIAAVVAVLALLLAMVYYMNANKAKRAKAAKAAFAAKQKHQRSARSKA